MVSSYWPPIGNHTLGIQWSRDRWRHVTPKRQSRDPDIFEAQYLDNRARYMVSSHWLPIRNHTLGIQRSRNKWRHVTPKCQSRDPQCLWSLIAQQPCKLHGRFILTTNIPEYYPILRIQWSHDRWRHLTWKVKVVTRIPLKLNITKIWRKTTKLRQIAKISILIIENRCRPNCNKTANINVKKLQFMQVLTAKCSD